MHKWTKQMDEVRQNLLITIATTSDTRLPSSHCFPIRPPSFLSQSSITSLSQSLSMSVPPKPLPSLPDCIPSLAPRPPTPLYLYAESFRTRSCPRPLPWCPSDAPRVSSQLPTAVVVGALRLSMFRHFCFESRTHPQRSKARISPKLLK